MQSPTKALEWTFDTVADTYAKLRPGYVPELYQALFDYMPIDRSSRVVEVGSGGGQATGPILATGCQLTAVEYGTRFSGLLREKFRNYPGFSVITGRFEDTPFEAASCDLVFSASAFHWIPEQIGYEKVYAMLRPGGAFARFANYPNRDKGDPWLSRAIDEVYDQYYYKYYGRPREKRPEFTEEMAKEKAMIAARYGFTEIQYRLFHRQRVISASDYAGLLGTYSDHIAMDADIRRAFFAAIEDVVHQHGGTITLYDTIDLQLARKG